MRIADFQADVNDEVNREAERVTVDALRRYFDGKPVGVKNIAHEHKKWDIILEYGGREHRLDVKCDSYIETSGRIAFETHEVSAGSQPRPSWGFDERIEYLAVVPRSLKWIKVFRLSFLRSYVGYMLAVHGIDALVEHYDWKSWSYLNNGWTTYGVAVPIAGFSAYLKYRDEYPVVQIETPAATHRRTGPRLTIGGKEAI
jgi:hypothetical protein